MAMAPKTRNEGELDLEATLGTLHTYRKSDPGFERAIADYVDAEASLKEDPAEGKRQASVLPGHTQSAG